MSLPKLLKLSSVCNHQIFDPFVGGIGDILILKSRSVTMQRLKLFKSTPKTCLPSTEKLFFSLSVNSDELVGAIIFLSIRLK